MKIFVTGTTGFIGSYVTKALLDRGDSVVAFVRNPHKVASFLKHPKYAAIQGELTDLDVLRRGLDGADACIHIALGWGDTPLEMLEKDTLPAVALLEAASKAGCKSFIYTSSTAAMGEMRNPMHEDLRCIPTDLYGATKSAVESFVLGYRASAMRRNIVRPGYTFGNPVVPDAFPQPDTRFRNIARAIQNGSELELIQYDGTQFIHAADLARLYLAILDSEVNGEAFLGLGRTWVSWEEVARKASAIAGRPVLLKMKDLGWGAEPMRFDVQKMKRFFGLSFDAWPALADHIAWNQQSVLREAQ
jgi:UDP-glucose 4-epimerase